MIFIKKYIAQLFSMIALSNAASTKGREDPFGNLNVHHFKDLYRFSHHWIRSPDFPVKFDKKIITSQESNKVLNYLEKQDPFIKIGSNNTVEIVNSQTSLVKIVNFSLVDLDLDDKINGFPTYHLGNNTFSKYELEDEYKNGRHSIEKLLGNTMINQNPAIVTVQNLDSKYVSKLESNFNMMQKPFSFVSSQMFTNKESDVPLVTIYNSEKLIFKKAFITKIDQAMYYKDLKSKEKDLLNSGIITAPIADDVVFHTIFYDKDRCRMVHSMNVCLSKVDKSDYIFETAGGKEIIYENLLKKYNFLSLKQALLTAAELKANWENEVDKVLTVISGEFRIGTADLNNSVLKHMLYTGQTVVRDSSKPDPDNKDYFNSSVAFNGIIFRNAYEKKPEYYSKFFVSEEESVYGTNTQHIFYSMDKSIPVRIWKCYDPVGCTAANPCIGGVGLAIVDTLFENDPNVPYTPEPSQF